jgi:hypothetical protein
LLSLRRAPLLATAFVVSVVLAGCVTATPAATPAATSSGVATPAATAAATAAPTATAVPSATAAVTPAPSSEASVEPSQAPVTTPVPGSSLDVTQSDAGVVGRLTIEDDTRPDRIGTDDHTGTSEIIGLAADGSDCDFSFSGDQFSAVAYYSDAPIGMLRQMSVYLPTDEMPANDGEQRAGIVDGGVYADFNSESGFGTTYSGDATQENDPGSSTIDIAVDGDSVVFTFTGATWDEIAFSGQMICSGVDLGS